MFENIHTKFVGIKINAYLCTRNSEMTTDQTRNAEWCHSSVGRAKD